MRSALLLVCLAAGCAGAQAEKSVGSPVSPREQYAALEARTVKLDEVCPAGTTGAWGSGVWLETNVVATAAHVAETQPGCHLEWEGRPVVTLVADQEHDVALLRVQSKRAWTRLPLAEGYRGQFVVVVGYPTQLLDTKPHLSVSPGFVSVDFGSRYRVTAPSTFGNSGGPVFTPDGQLVAIWVALHTFMQSDVPIDGAYYATPASYVRKLQASLK